MKAAAFLRSTLGECVSTPKTAAKWLLASSLFNLLTSTLNPHVLKSNLKSPTQSTSTVWIMLQAGTSLPQATSTERWKSLTWNLKKWSVTPSITTAEASSASNSVQTDEAFLQEAKTYTSTCAMLSRKSEPSRLWTTPTGYHQLRSTQCNHSTSSAPVLTKRWRSGKQGTTKLWRLLNLATRYGVLLSVHAETISWFVRKMGLSVLYSLLFDIFN